MTTSQNSLGHEPTDDELRIALGKTKWGKTSVTDFIHKADMNTRITYLNLQGYFEMLEGVGDIFKMACDTVGCSDLSNSLTLWLLERAYGSYLAAVRLSSSGQLTESYVLFRACIENALYAFNIYNDPKLAQIWIERRKGEESRRKSVNLFKPSTIIDKLKQRNYVLGMKIKTDYEIYIDFGAHPNEMSVAMNLKMKNRKYSLDLLNTTQGRFQMCLSMCVTCGLNAIRVFNLIYPDDFKKFNAEQRIQTILEQYWRIAPEVDYKLSTTSP